MKNLIILCSLFCSAQTFALTNCKLIDIGNGKIYATIKDQTPLYFDIQDRILVSEEDKKEGDICVSVESDSSGIFLSFGQLTKDLQVNLIVGSRNSESLSLYDDKDLKITCKL